MTCRLNWSQQEESTIKTLRQVDNIASWKKIAQTLNEKFTDTIRTGKQCRDRYINYIRFTSQNPKLLGWTLKDDITLFQKFQQYGSRWVLISSEMQGRSENNIKNRFYGAIRKVMRKIAKVEKQMKPKPKKLIKERQLIKIFQESRKPSESQKKIGFACSLYGKLLDMAISQEDLISTDDIKAVIVMINSKTNHRALEVERQKSLATEGPTLDQGQQSEQVQFRMGGKEDFVELKETRMQEMDLEKSINNFQQRSSSSFLRDSLKLDFVDFRALQNDMDFEPFKDLHDPFMFDLGNYML